MRKTKPPKGRKHRKNKHQRRKSLEIPRMAVGSISFGEVYKINYRTENRHPSGNFRLKCDRFSLSNRNPRGMGCVPYSGLVHGMEAKTCQISGGSLLISYSRARVRFALALVCGNWSHRVLTLDVGSCCLVVMCSFTWCHREGLDFKQSRSSHIKAHTCHLVLSLSVQWMHSP